MTNRSAFLKGNFAQMIQCVKVINIDSRATTTLSEVKGDRGEERRRGGEDEECEGYQHRIPGLGIPSLVFRVN